MAKNVTRTITNTVVTAMCGGDGKNELFPVEITIPGDIKDEKAAKMAAKVYDTDAHKVVYVKTVNHVSNLYSVSEDEFMKIATILPPRKNTKNNTKKEG